MLFYNFSACRQRSAPPGSVPVAPSKTDVGGCLMTLLELKPSYRAEVGHSKVTNPNRVLLAGFSYGGSPLLRRLDDARHGPP